MPHIWFPEVPCIWTFEDVVQEWLGCWELAVIAENHWEILAELLKAGVAEPDPVDVSPDTWMCACEQLQRLITRGMGVPCG